MDLSKTKKATWIFFCLLLFLPFVIEKFFVAPVTLTREPLYIWGAVHFIYCYISYGTVCFLYSKWRKKIDDRIIMKPDRRDLRWLVIAALMGVAGRYIFKGIAVFVFNSTIIHFSAPMIYREFVYYISGDSLLLGIGGYVMQYILYIFEFTLIAFTVDCAQKTSMKFGWSQKSRGEVFFLFSPGGFYIRMESLTLFYGKNMRMLCRQRYAICSLD